MQPTRDANTQSTLPSYSKLLEAENETKAGKNACLLKDNSHEST
jgi:hypothetical protein